MWDSFHHHHCPNMALEASCSQAMAGNHTWNKANDGPTLPYYRSTFDKFKVALSSLSKSALSVISLQDQGLSGWAFPHSTLTSGRRYRTYRFIDKNAA